MPKKEDLTGRLFGRLVALYEGMPSKHGRSRWYCKCECGNSKLIETSHLLQGYTLSCGCLQKEKAGRTEDLVGRVFGRLTVIQRAGSKNQKSTWLCRCSCGNEKVIVRRSLTSGDTKSCGCYRKEKTAKLAETRTPRQKIAHMRQDKRCPSCEETKPVAEFPKNVTTSDGYGCYCKPCHNRIGRENTRKKHGNRGYHLKRRYGITQEDFNNLLESQKGLCAICEKSGGQKPWHVDHDHSSGKVRGILCHPCNTALGNFNDDPEILERALKYLSGDKQYTKS